MKERETTKTRKQSESRKRSKTFYPRSVSFDSKMKGCDLMTITKDNYEKQASRIAHLTADNLVSLGDYRKATTDTMSEYGFEFDCDFLTVSRFFQLTSELVENITDRNYEDEMENEND